MREEAGRRWEGVWQNADFWTQLLHSSALNSCGQLQETKATQFINIPVGSATWTQWVPGRGGGRWVELCLRETRKGDLGKILSRYIISPCLHPSICPINQNSLGRLPITHSSLLSIFNTSWRLTSVVPILRRRRQMKNKTLLFASYFVPALGSTGGKVFRGSNLETEGQVTSEPDVCCLASSVYCPLVLAPCPRKPPLYTVHG